MEWSNYTLTAILGAVGGALSVGVPLLLKWWREANAISKERERDEYEMDKIRRSDAVKEILSAQEEMKKSFAEERREWRSEITALTTRIESQARRIEDLQAKELECQRNSLKQEAENLRQAKIIEYLEGRVKALEASILPTPPASALASAVKDVVAEK